MTPSRPEALNI